MIQADARNRFELLEKRLEIKFNNSALLVEALTHRSYLNECAHSTRHNEVLEFLGDAALEICVTEFLFHRFGRESDEGELSRTRAALVNTNNLAHIAEGLKLDEMLLMSRGQRESLSGKARTCLLANAFEAVIGAIYLDRGVDVCKIVVDKLVCATLTEALSKFQEPKSKLQEVTQARWGITPRYTVISEHGPDHAKLFRVAVMLDGVSVGEAGGASKKEAETKAAQVALASLDTLEARLGKRV